MANIGPEKGCSRQDSTRKWRPGSLLSAVGRKRQSATLVATLMFASATAVAEPLVAPVVFAPGVISSGANDGAPTISPDGRALYFERTNGRWSAILESHSTAGQWSAPELASFSGTSSDQQPTLSPDGSYLIFVSSRPLPAPNGTDPNFASHLYRVNREPQGWSDPVELPTSVNISDRVFKPSIAGNGDLYFMSDVGGASLPQWRLFVARRTAGGYAPAEPLPFSGPEDHDVDPFIASDQSFLIFSSNTRGDIHDAHEHLFITRRTASGWSAIAPIRYEGDTLGADDGEAQVSPDGTTLYFTSSRVPPMARVRTPETTQEGLQRMNTWDNGNSNVWMLPTTGFGELPAPK